MNYLNWIIPAVIVLFIVGKVAEALRAMRGSLEEDLSFLRTAVGDIEHRQALPPAEGRPALPAATHRRINALLEQSRRALQTCPSGSCPPRLTYLQRLALRTQVKRALKTVSQARSLLRPYIVEDSD